MMDDYIEVNKVHASYICVEMSRHNMTNIGHGWPECLAQHGTVPCLSRALAWAMSFVSCLSCHSILSFLGFRLKKKKKKML